MWSGCVLVLTLLPISLLWQLTKKAITLLFSFQLLSSSITNYVISILFLPFVIDLRVSFIFLPTQLFASFLSDCFCTFFSFSKALLLSDGICLSSIYISSKIGFLSKSGKDVVALDIKFLQVYRFLTRMTLFWFLMWNL